MLILRPPEGTLTAGATMTQEGPPLKQQITDQAVALHVSSETRPGDQIL